MHKVNVKGILSSYNGMNLCRGCLHGCIYCDSRSRCYHIEHDFEDIELKENAPLLLEDALKRKRTSFADISDAALQRVVWLINNRPRKRLGFRTPAEMLEKFLHKVLHLG